MGRRAAGAGAETAAPLRAARTSRPTAPAALVQAAPAALVEAAPAVLLAPRAWRRALLGPLPSRRAPRPCRNAAKRWSRRRACFPRCLIAYGTKVWTSGANKNNISIAFA